MSDLKPCPFCGAGTFEIRPNGRMWLGMKYSEPASVSVLHWCEAMPGQPSRVIERVGRDEASATEAWNRRAQPAQAVPASCGECGKKTSDGWALYCVACMEKAGLPAQAGPLLSDAEIQAAWVEHGLDDCAVEDFARAIEQAVRAKMGAAVPMTEAQIAEFQDDGVFFQSCKHIVRDIEKFHGIVGKEGA